MTYPIFTSGNDLLIFAADNFINPQDSGNLPFEDASYKSSLKIDDQMTWVGGGTSKLVSITDERDSVFDEALNDQTLTNAVDWQGQSYDAGQIVTPTYTIVFEDGDGNEYILTSFNFAPNTEGKIPDAAFWEGSIPPKGTVLTVTNEINPTRGDSRPYDEFVSCFATGTLISTPDGEVAVETLKDGDLVLTTEGHAVAARWIGHQTIATRFGAAERLSPIKFAAGSLGHNLPHTDLVVTADHGMFVDGVICHAGALVNGDTITRVPLSQMGERFTVYHIDTEEHAMISANGAPAETFIDNATRSAFDNFADFEAKFGDAPEIEELPYPRAMTARQVPAETRKRLALAKRA